MNKNERAVLCKTCRKKLNKIEAKNKAEYRAKKLTDKKLKVEQK